MNGSPADSLATGTAWQCPPRTILVAVDFGEASARAVALAATLASEFGAKLRAVHAERFEPPPYFTFEQIARLEAERRAGQTAAVHHLARFAGSAGAATVDPVVVDGPPVEAILETAAGADLIVMGTHGRRGPGRWWLGSVAERVVRAARIPVLVTRAASSPARDVFSRVTLADEGLDAVVRACAESLAHVGGHPVVEAGSVSTCATDTVQRASLIVIGREPERTSWLAGGTAARVLSACSAPVISVPSPGSGEDGGNSNDR